jgi:hypothetical protein
MRLPKGDRCGTPFRRLFPGGRWLAEVGGGGELCTTLLLSLLAPLVLVHLLAPLVLVHESSESDRTSLSAGAGDALFLLPPPPPCFFFPGR